MKLEWTAACYLSGIENKDKKQSSVKSWPKPDCWLICGEDKEIQSTGLSWISILGPLRKIRRNDYYDKGC